jgi:hypothetical protein
MPLVSNNNQMLGSPGRFPEQGPAPSSPGALDVAASAERLSNLGGALYDHFSSGGAESHPSVPGFDPLASIPKGYEQHADKFLDAYSPEDVQTIKQKIDREQMDRQTISRAGKWGFAASLAAGATDPLNLASMLIPMGGETRIAQAMKFALVNAGTTAAQEGVMHEISPTRTMGESLLNVGASTVLGGILGGALKVPSRTFGRLSRELHEEFQPGGGEKILGPTQRSVLDTALPSDHAVTAERVPVGKPEAPKPQEVPEGAPLAGPSKKLDQMEAEFKKSQEPGLMPPGEPVHGEEHPSQTVASLGNLDERLAKDEQLRSDLNAMKNETGWAEKGGRLMRNEETGEVTGRTKWIPNAEWWPGRPGGFSPDEVNRILDKATSGQKLGPKQRALVEYMADVADTRRANVAYRPEEEDLTSIFGKHTEADAQESAMVARAAEIDPDRVESLAKQHEDNDAEFLRGIKALLDENAAATRGSEARPPEEAISSPLEVNPNVESTAGAAAVAKANLESESIARGARTIAEGPIGHVAPGLRLLKSPSLEVRRLVQDLANVPEMLAKNLEGIKTPPPVERDLWGYEGTWWQAWKERGDLFRQYRERIAGRPVSSLGWWLSRPEGALSRREFGQEVSAAMRRGDEHAIPEVAQAAQKTRAIVFEPLKARAQTLGLLPPEVQATGADSYLTRQYDATKIRANLGKWLATLREGFQAQGIDPAEASDIAHRVTRNVLGSERGTMDWRVMDDIVPQSGRLKERTLNLPDTLLEPYLNSDIDHLSHSYLRSMAPEVEMTERFGSRDLKDQIDAIKDEYARLMEKARYSGQDVAALEKQMRNDLRDISAIRDRLYGIYGAPKDPGALAVRAGRMLRGDNALRLLGAATLAHFPDLANTILRYGMPNTFGAIAKILTSSNAMNLTRTEAKRMGAALDMTMNLTSSILGDYGSHSQFAEQRMMAKLTRAFTIGTGETPLITMVQSLTSTLAQDEILRTAEKVAAGGKIGSNQTARLASAGLDAEMLQRIAKQASFTQEANGLRFGMSDKWEDQQAAAAFESAVLKEAHGVTLRPGAGDTPLFMSGELGKLILQFKTFAFASSRIVVNPLLQGLARGDPRAAQGLLALTFMGSMSYASKQIAAGQPIELDNPKRFALEVMDKSNLLGWTSEVVFPGLWQMGMKDFSRWSDRNAMETVLGPSAGTVGGLYEKRIPAKLTAQDGEKGFDRSDLHFLRRLMPGQNLWYMRRGVNALEDMMGDAFDLPGKSNADRAAEVKQ